VTELPRIAEQFRAARRNPELAVLEGVHAVKHALRFGAALSAMVGTDADELDRLAALLAPDLRGRFAAGLRVVSPGTFSQLAPQTPRTGVIAIAKRPRVDLGRLIADRGRRPIVLLEDPRNLANIGACVRAAAAADVAGVVTTGPRDPWQADALRGSAGLHFALPVTRIEEASFHDRPLLAVDPCGTPFVPARMPSRAVLAFGTERYGISDQLLARADARISIPMRAGVSSLNLATSVAAILFAWRLAGDELTHAAD
jgi:RNA methyltransferase, TrmH family